MAPLPTRKLGPNGPEVTAIGIGLMGLSVFYGPAPPDEERFAFLDHVYASGQRFWDTADMYGDSEDLLGRWFRRNPGKRETIFLATKFGNTPKGVRTDPAYVAEACARSLARLGIDSIDLYYVHRIDDVTPIEETMEALVELKNQKKIRYLGLSEASAATLRRAHAVHPITAVQAEYSPYAMDIELPANGLRAACDELGIAVVCYSPLGRGILTGRLRSPDDLDATDFRRMFPRYLPDNFAHNLTLADTLAARAESKGNGCTPAQLTLAWLLHQGEGVVPIPGTKRIAYYDENMGALRVTVTDEDDRIIRAAIAQTEVAGDRYPALAGGRLYADAAERKEKK